MGTKQERLPTSSSTVTQKTAQATNTVILTANQNRITFEVMNNADKPLYLLIGGTGNASATNFTVCLAPKNAQGVGGYYSPPGEVRFLGEVKGIWGAGPTGDAMVTEYA